MLATQNKPIGLDSIVGLAHFEAQKGDLQKAVELQTLVKNHPVCHWGILQKANRLWDDLVVELSPELISKAEARGRELDLFDTAEALAA